MKKFLERCCVKFAEAEMKKGVNQICRTWFYQEKLPKGLKEKFQKKQ